MDEEERHLLTQILDVTKDNNRMLSKLYRSLWWSKVWRATYWVFVAGLILGGYIAVQPYLDNIKAIYHSMLNNYENVKGVVIP